LCLFLFGQEVSWWLHRISEPNFLAPSTLTRTYYHAYEATTDGLGLIIEFTEHLQTAITSNNKSSRIVYTFTTVCTKSSQSAVSSLMSSASALMFATKPHSSDCRLEIQLNCQLLMTATITAAPQFFQTCGSVAHWNNVLS
jgi:hypothetical protein